MLGIQLQSKRAAWIIIGVPDFHGRNGPMRKTHRAQLSPSTWSGRTWLCVVTLAIVAYFLSVAPITYVLVASGNNNELVRFAWGLYVLPGSFCVAFLEPLLGPIYEWEWNAMVWLFGDPKK